MQIELIVIDLDGTLLHSDLSIGKRTLSAIRGAQNKGIKITFATGRMVSASAKYADIAEIAMPIVALNGAIVAGHRNGKIIFHKQIDCQYFEKILPIIAETKAVATVVFGDRAFGWNFYGDMRERLSSWIVAINDIKPHDSPKNPTIVLVAGDEKDVRQTAENILRAKINGIQLFLFPSIRYYPMWYFEIRAAGVNKGAGLQALRNALKIPKRNILAIGDYVNDLSMFAESGISATVANAHQEVLNAADYVSPLSNDLDGVGEIIEKFAIK